MLLYILARSCRTDWVIRAKNRILRQLRARFCALPYSYKFLCPFTRVVNLTIADLSLRGSFPRFDRVARILMFKLHQHNQRLHAHRSVLLFIAEGWQNRQFYLLSIIKHLSLLCCDINVARCCCEESHSRKRAAIQRGASSKAATRRKDAKRTPHQIFPTMDLWPDTCAWRWWLISPWRCRYPPFFRIPL